MKNKIKKTYILITVYVIMLVAELVLCVPYDKIEIFRSEQNVPHSEIIGSGYASVFDIADDVAIVEGKAWTATGKRIDTPQLLMNVTLTTLIAAAIYLLFLFKKKKPVSIPTGNIAGEQLSLFDIVDLENATEITVHTLSSKNGYYKDVIERTEENAALIDKWIDKSTGCLYMTIMYKDGEPESVLVTKEFFETIYKHFEMIDGDEV